MKVVLTTVVRDDADVLDAHLRFHLAAGVDIVLATDRAATGEAREILRAYERGGVLRRVEAAGDDEAPEPSLTLMARLAASRHGADWIVGGSPYEFWWPRGPSLKDVLERIPPEFGIVEGIVRNFVPVSGGEGPLFERMVWRLSSQAPIDDPTSPWRPSRRVAHHASSTVTVETGRRAIRDTPFRALRGWYPLEVLRFPARPPVPLDRPAGPPSDDPFAAVGSSTLEEAVAREILSRDVRLRDVLRVLRKLDVSALARSDLRLPTPSIVDDALFAADVAGLGESDLVRARQSIDEIDARLRAMESAIPVRLERGLRSLAYRLRSRAASGRGR